MKTLDQYLTNKETSLSKCKNYDIITGDQGFSIIEKEHKGQRYDYLGTYNHTVINKYLTVLRNNKYKVFMGSLKKVVEESIIEFTMTVHEFFSLSHQLKDYLNTNYHLVNNLKQLGFITK